MLKHTKKIKEMYEDIQKRIFYMIPEKCDKIYLYCQVSDKIDRHKTGELFFYYIPKGIFKRNPVNVYEIPQKFNLDEKEYLKLVNLLYEKIVLLREEFKKAELVSNWTNLTMIIDETKFKIEYDYEAMKEIKEKELIREIVRRRERYEEGIYIKNIKNIVDYDTESYLEEQNIEYVATKDDSIRNQIMSH